MSTKESEITYKVLKNSKNQVKFITIQEWKQLQREKEIKAFKDFSASLKLSPLSSNDPFAKIGLYQRSNYK